MSVIRIITCNGDDTGEFDDTFLVEYDPSIPGSSPTGEPMIAHIVVTKDRSKAMQFTSVIDAAECWRQSYGTRPDGLPNRPLTAFTIEIV